MERMEKLRVLLVQLPVPASPALNTPLAAGYLKAYAEARGLDAEIAILPRAIADDAGDAALVEAIVAHAPHVLGLSLYTWNSERALAIAARARQRLPGLIVIAGGPEVQPDNAWVLEHPALDVAVVGEGEQTFAELLERLSTGVPTSALAGTPGTLIRGAGGLIAGPERVALSDLAVIPSPYLAGHLELVPEGMQLVEVSRWCPYSCSFCLYGRAMGPRLGNRYFGLERVLAEVAWGKARGVRTVHFVEANLNLVPIFWPLMRALADLNADRQITFYAELRGEHLSDSVVEALDAANVRVVEVGLQTANPAALRAARRRTDLAKWAAGTRRLYTRGIEVLLDVILGLPADDATGIAETLAFLDRERLGPYDTFTLQVLPGTLVRREASDFGLVFQDRPPYFVLATDRLSFAELRRLRRELKLGAGLAPDTLDGAPRPRPLALACHTSEESGQHGIIHRVLLDDRTTPPTAEHLAAHVDVLLPAEALERHTETIAEWIAANPATVIDLYLLAGSEAPPAAALQNWRATLPFTPGYLDRVAVTTRETPEPAFARVSPRLFLVLPWSSQAEPADFAGVAEVIWRYDLAPGEALPLGAWRAAGGAGIWLHPPPGVSADERDALFAEARAWASTTGQILFEA